MVRREVARAAEDPQLLAAARTMSKSAATSAGARRGRARQRETAILASSRTRCCHPAALRAQHGVARGRGRRGRARRVVGYLLFRRRIENRPAPAPHPSPPSAIPPRTTAPSTSLRRRARPLAASDRARHRSRLPGGRRRPRDRGGHRGRSARRCRGDRVAGHPRCSRRDHLPVGAFRRARAHRRLRRSPGRPPGTPPVAGGCGIRDRELSLAVGRSASGRGRAGSPIVQAMSVYDDFPDLVAWLEARTRGVGRHR